MPTQSNRLSKPIKNSNFPPFWTSLSPSSDEIIETLNGQLNGLREALKDAEKSNARLRAEIVQLQLDAYPVLLKESKRELENRAVTESSMAVLFVDLIGYSQMTWERQVEVKQILRDLVVFLGQPKRYHAKCPSTWGDAVCIGIEDVNKAFLFALRLIEHSKIESISIRIGISYGQLSIEYDQVMKSLGLSGRVMSEAARLEPLAGPGEIIVSSSMRYCPHVNESMFELTKVSRKLKKAIGDKNAGDSIECYTVSKKVMPMTQVA